MRIHEFERVGRVHLRGHREHLRGARPRQVDRRHARARRVSPVDHQLVRRGALRPSDGGRPDVESERDAVRRGIARVRRRDHHEIALRQLVRGRRRLPRLHRVGIVRNLGDEALMLIRDRRQHRLRAIRPRVGGIRRHRRQGDGRRVRLVDVEPASEIRVDDRAAGRRAGCPPGRRWRRRSACSAASRRRRAASAKHGIATTSPAASTPNTGIRSLALAGELDTAAYVCGSYAVEVVAAW